MEKVKREEAEKMINGITLPRHTSMTIEHNGHCIYCESIEEYCDAFVWVNEDECVRAKLSQEVWVARWHTDTPVGPISYAASNLNVLLNHIKDMV